MSSLPCAQLRGRPGHCRLHQRGAHRSWPCCQAKLDCHLYDLRNELVPYKQGWQWQKQLLDARLQSGTTMPGVLLLLQHPSVYTLGESRTAKPTARCCGSTTANLCQQAQAALRTTSSLTWHTHHTPCIAQSAGERSPTMAPGSWLPTHCWIYTSMCQTCTGTSAALKRC